MHKDSPRRTSSTFTARASASRPIDVLSIQIPTIGNRSYGNSLRAAFSERTDMRLRAFWTQDCREFHARAINKLLSLHGPRALNERNLDFRRTRAELGYAYFGRRLAQQALRAQAADVLHFHTQTPALLAVDLMRSTPTVITTDQTAMQIAAEGGRRWQWTHEPTIRLERVVLRAAAAVVAFSELTARLMIREHGVPAERVSVIPPGVDLRFFAGFAPDRTHPGPLRILFVGSQFQRKGGNDLVSVFLDRFGETDVELHLVTREGLIPEHPRIFVYRDVEAYSAQWRHLYGTADVFAMPSHHDAFGIAPIEAMAAGLPAVVSAIEPLSDSVADGETGFLVPPGDRRALGNSLEALLADAALRRRFGAAGQGRVRERFDSRVNAERLSVLFHSMVRPRQ